MKPLWAIQKASLNDADSQGMREALDLLNIPYTLINIPPFINTVDDIDVEWNGLIIPYGGTKFIDLLFKTGKKGWVCFFNDNFRYHIALDKFGKLMFNSDGKYMKMSEFNPSMYPKGEYIFIRPDKDIKEFAGNTMKPEDFMTWYRQIHGKGWDVNENTEIIVANASRIDYEWRTYVVGDNVVGASRYRKNHYQSIDADVPDEVYDFVKNAIKIWKPSDVFVMDICKVNDELSILEIGDLHSCGWYASNKKDVLGAVSDYVEKNY